MFFHIEHLTEYNYPQPAVEAFTELRLRPRDSLRQEATSYSTRLDPPVVADNYTDYFGNFVETVSIPFRHERLSVTSVCDIRTKPQPDALGNLSLTLCEARLLYRSHYRQLFDFLRPSRYVPFDPKLSNLANELLPETRDFTQSILGLNEWVHSFMTYTPGVTDVNTSASKVIEKREGVCQDYAHLMLGICRIAEIPARYVSGYIETDPAPEGELVGATASHAWLEVLSPNGCWVGLDPTNRILEGARHVQIGIGRDYADVPPLKGVFKGPDRQTMDVTVRVTRNELTRYQSQAKATAPNTDYVAEHRAPNDLSLHPSREVRPSPAADPPYRGP